MNSPPQLPGISGLKEIGRNSLVVGYKGTNSDGMPVVVEVFRKDIWSGKIGEWNICAKGSGPRRFWTRKQMVDLDRVVLQNDSSGFSESVYGKVNQGKSDIAYKEAQSPQHGGIQAVVTRQVKDDKVVYTREHFGYSWDRAGDRAVIDRASGEVLSYRYREGTTLPESIATIAANPLSWVLGGTVGYMVGVPGSLGFAAGIGAGVGSVAGVGVMHWVQSKGN